MKSSVLEECQLLEMANDGGLQSMFGTTSVLLTLWMKVKAEYPEIATKAPKRLLPFPMFYLCEEGFLQPKRDDQEDWTEATHFSAALSSHPRWDHPVAGKRAQGSH